MIEINLLPGRKNLTGLAGISNQFSVINFKLLFIVLLLHFLARPVVVKYWEVGLNNIKSELAIVQKNFEIVKKKNMELSAVGKQADELVEKERKLNEKLDVVKQILKEKKNPMGMMFYMAKNIPEDVWIDNIKIFDDKIEIVGESQSYKSIGNFMNALQSSIFFGNKVKLDDSQTKLDEKTGKRTEQFKLVSEIVRYN